MFVRSRASRTRAGAHGAALDLVAAYLSRAGTLEADESGRTLGILAVNSLRRYAATSVRIPCSGICRACALDRSSSIVMTLTRGIV
jgi:hypothetical protein